MTGQPLSDAFAATLKSDSNAALAAAFIIGTHHSEVLLWVAKTISPAPAEPPARTQGNGVAKPPPKAKGNGAESHRAKPPAARKASTNAQPKSKGIAAHLALRREARDRDDENLRHAMRDSPEASIRDWAATISKSRSSVVSALHRLRDAGVVESVEGKWTLVEEPAPRVTAPKWVAPLSAASHAHVSP